MFKFGWNSCVNNGQECSVKLPLYCAASPTPKKSKQVQVVAKCGTMTTSTSCTELIFWKVELFFGHFVDCLTICEFLQRLSVRWLYSVHLCTEQKRFFYFCQRFKNLLLVLYVKDKKLGNTDIGELMHINKNECNTTVKIAILEMHGDVYF